MAPGAMLMFPCHIARIEGERCGVVSTSGAGDGGRADGEVINSGSKLGVRIPVFHFLPSLEPHTAPGPLNSGGRDERDGGDQRGEASEVRGQGCASTSPPARDRLLVHQQGGDVCGGAGNPRRTDGGGRGVALRASEAQALVGDPAVGHGSGGVSGEDHGEEVGGIHLVRDRRARSCHERIGPQISRGRPSASCSAVRHGSDCDSRRPYGGGPDAASLCWSSTTTTNSDMLQICFIIFMPPSFSFVHENYSHK